MSNGPACAMALLAIAVGAGGCAGAAAQAPTPGRDWLDRRPLVEWNQPGAALPPAPAGAGDSEGRQRCAAVIRAPASAADEALLAAGWSLFGPVSGEGDTAVVMGNAAWDGMCRPWAFQLFVFVGGRFAGTLSPVLMNARTDGAGQSARPGPSGHLTAAFVRYEDSDPLCCPSRLSEVVYRIDRRPSGPVVVPLGVGTRPLPR